MTSCHCGGLRGVAGVFPSNVSGAVLFHVVGVEVHPHSPAPPAVDWTFSPTGCPAVAVQPACPKPTNILTAPGCSPTNASMLQRLLHGNPPASGLRSTQTVSSWLAVHRHGLALKQSTLAGPVTARHDVESANNNPKTGGAASGKP